MASGLTYLRADLTQATDALRAGMRNAAHEAMGAAMRQAEADAKSVHQWRNPGRYEEDYPSGHWSWEVTGMATASITGYVVPDKDLKGSTTTVTTSFHDGISLQHPHIIDDGITADYQENSDTIKGVLTMNISYAPYLQDYETVAFGDPVVIEVLAANWGSYYVPSIIAPEIERALSSIISQYT